MFLTDGSQHNRQSKHEHDLVRARPLGCARPPHARQTSARPSLPSAAPNRVSVSCPVPFPPSPTHQPGGRSSAATYPAPLPVPARSRGFTRADRPSSNAASPVFGMRNPPICGLAAS